MPGHYPRPAGGDRIASCSCLRLSMVGVLPRDIFRMVRGDSTDIINSAAGRAAWSIRRMGWGVVLPEWGPLTWKARYGDRAGRCRWGGAGARRT